MARSRLDPVQMQQMAFDEDLGASRVHLVDADIAIELAAEDGDSVITKVQSEVIPVSDEQVLDLSMYTKVCLIGANQAHLKLVVDNKEILVYTIDKGVIKDIILTNVKIKLIDPEEQAYLLVQ